MGKAFDYYCSYYKRRTYRKGDFCGECGERIYAKPTVISAQPKATDSTERGNQDD